MGVPLSDDASPRERASPGQSRLHGASPMVHHFSAEELPDGRGRRAAGRARGAERALLGGERPRVRLQMRQGPRGRWRSTGRATSESRQRTRGSGLAWRSWSEGSAQARRRGRAARARGQRALSRALRCLDRTAGGPSRGRAPRRDQPDRLRAVAHHPEQIIGKYNALEDPQAVKTGHAEAFRRGACRGGGHAAPDPRRHRAG